MTRLEKSLLLALWALVALAGWAFPAMALDAGTLRASSYELSIRPEFDTADVLVINNVVLVNEDDRPYQGRVGFRVPKGAQLSMVCEIAPGGGHACQPFKTEDRGDYVEVSWNATHPIVRGERFPIYVEYYYDPFESRLPRRFTHRFFPVYPMDNLYVVVTEPKGASAFQLTPEAALSRPVKDGTVDWQYTFEDQPAELIEFQVSYNRKDDAPSVGRPESGQSGAPAPQAGGGPGTAAGPGGAAGTAAASGQPSGLTLALVTFILAGVGAAFFVIARSGRR